MDKWVKYEYICQYFEWQEKELNIQEAKEELIRTVKVYTRKDETGQYKIPLIRQRPVFLIGAPGIGKTAIVEQHAM